MGLLERLRSFRRSGVLHLRTAVLRVRAVRVGKEVLLAKPGWHGDSRAARLHGRRSRSAPGVRSILCRTGWNVWGAMLVLQPSGDFTPQRAPEMRERSQEPSSPDGHMYGRNWLRRAVGVRCSWQPGYGRPYHFCLRGVRVGQLRIVILGSGKADVTRMAGGLSFAYHGLYAPSALWVTRS